MWKITPDRWYQSSWVQFSSLHIKSAITCVIISPSITVTSYLWLPLQFDRYAWFVRVYKIWGDPLETISSAQIIMILGAMRCPQNVKLKLPILRTYASYANIQCSTAHYFIAIEMAFNSKENDRLLVSFPPLQANLKMSSSRRSPYITIVYQHWDIIDKHIFTFIIAFIRKRDVL